MTLTDSNGDMDSPSFGKLYGVAQKIKQDLLQPKLVSGQIVRHKGRDLCPDVKSLPMDEGDLGLNDVAYAPAQAEISSFQFDLARFNL